MLHVSHKFLEIVTAKNVKRPSKFRLPSSDKYSTQVVLDTDEESMAEYMRNMSPSSSGELVKTPRSKSPPSARRKVSESG